MSTVKGGRDADTNIFERLAADNAEMEAQLKALADEQRAELDALLRDLNEKLAGIRIPPPGISKPAFSGPGRRPKLTPETCWAVCEALSHGAPLHEAARAAGVGKATLHRWQARGRRETAGPYREFRDRVREVSALVHMHAVASIRASKSWRAHAWWLERRYPREWGRRRLELATRRPPWVRPR